MRLIKSHICIYKFYCIKLNNEGGIVMNPLREKILIYLDEKNEYIKIKDDEEYKNASQELSQSMNNLSDYLKDHKDKEIIQEYVAEILIASDCLNNVLRCFDFHTAFFIGLKLGKEVHKKHYTNLIDKLDDLVLDNNKDE